MPVNERTWCQGNCTQAECCAGPPPPPVPVPPPPPPLARCVRLTSGQTDLDLYRGTTYPRTCAEAVSGVNGVYTDISTNTETEGGICTNPNGPGAAPFLSDAIVAASLGHKNPYLAWDTYDEMQAENAWRDLIGRDPPANRADLLLTKVGQGSLGITSPAGAGEYFATSAVRTAENCQQVCGLRIEVVTNLYFYI